MNARRKGSGNELKAVKELERQGWFVYRVKGSTKYNKNVDIFGLFDLVAKKGLETIWVQVKTNKKPKMDKFRNFYAKHCSFYESVEVWVYKDYKGLTRYSVI